MTPERFEKIKRVLSMRQPDLTVLLDRVHKPHNIAAVVRTCDAVGIPRIHAVSLEAEMPRHAAISRGSRKWVSVRVHAGLAQAVDELRGAGMQLIAAHAGKPSADFRDVDYTRPSAIVLGAELWGVSDEILAQADHCIFVPMLGMVASLNVSVAAAVVLYEAQRQRQRAGRYRSSSMSEAELERAAFEWAYPRIARYCRERGRSYPRLGADGALPPRWRADGPA